MALAASSWSPALWAQTPEVVAQMRFDEGGAENERQQLLPFCRKLRSPPWMPVRRAKPPLTLSLSKGELSKAEGVAGQRRVGGVGLEALVVGAGRVIGQRLAQPGRDLVGLEQQAAVMASVSDTTGGRSLPTGRPSRR